MDLEDLYCSLAYGELSNLGMSRDGTIVEKHKPTIVNYANEALTRIYSRFVLKENDVIVEMLEGVTFYHLLKRYAEQSYVPGDIAYPYIRDLGREKFEEDVLRILSVFTSNGCRLPLNDESVYTSVFTPQANTLQNSNPVPGEMLSITYQAKHSALRCNDMEASHIELPSVLEGALRSYIAYKVYLAINTPEAVRAASGHYETYETICALIVDRDTVSNTVSLANGRFTKGGWI